MSKRHSTKALLSKTGAIARRVVAYCPDYATLTGSLPAGVMLSQMCYWSQTKAAEERDGWFYKTRDELAEETGINRSGQETARKILVRMGIIEEERRGVPAKMFFRVNAHVLEQLLMGESDQPEKQEPSIQVGPNRSIQLAGIKPTITENTQEITTETKNNMGISDEIPDAEDNPKPNDLFGNEHPVDRKPCPWEAILEKWAEIMPDKQQPSKNMWQGTSRANDLAQRWKACFSIKHEATGKPLYTTTEEGIEWWGRFFAYMRKSDFLMGKAGNARWFKLDWIVKKSNFVKIMENHYHQ